MTYAAPVQTYAAPTEAAVPQYYAAPVQTYAAPVATPEYSESQYNEWRQNITSHIQTAADAGSQYQPVAPTGVSPSVFQAVTYAAPSPMPMYAGGSFIAMPPAAAPTYAAPEAPEEK